MATMPLPCPNCGHLRPGRRAFMNASAWGHCHMVCSSACGRRLAIKLDTGMIDLAPPPLPYGDESTAYWHARRVADLRNEIRRLRHLLKRSATLNKRDRVDAERLLEALAELLPLVPLTSESNPAHTRPWEVKKHRIVANARAVLKQAQEATR